MATTTMAYAFSMEGDEKLDKTRYSCIIT